MNRKRLTLVILLGVLVVCLVYAFWASPRQEQVAPRSVAKPLPRSMDRIVQDRTDTDSVEAQVGSLSEEPESFPGAERDIFNFYVPKPVAPPRPKPVPPPQPVVTRPVVPQPDPMAQMQRALGQFTFLGFLEKAAVKSVFLKNASDIYIVKAGQSFGKKDELYVDSITDQELVARHKTQGTSVTVKLVENEQLSPSVSAPARSIGGGSAPPELPRHPVMPKRRTVRFPAQSRGGSGLEPVADEEPINEPIKPINEPYNQEPLGHGDETEGGPNGSNR